MPEMWPSSLPSTPLVEGLTHTPSDTTIRVETDGGVRTRASSIVVDAVTECAIYITMAQATTLKNFYETTLKNGTLTFTGLRLPPGLSATAELQFDEPPTLQVLSPTQVLASMAISER